MQNTIMQAAKIGFGPIFRIFLKEKSSPRVNMRKITPMSAHDWILLVSVTEGV